MEPNDSHQSLRRILLPSGRCVEVVRFQEQPSQRQLHLCPQCSSDLVHPLEWNEAANGRWELSLECPNCWWKSEGMFEREQVHELEDRLDDGFARMLDDLKRLTHANMAEQIDRFLAALHCDQILPEDF